jgi:hypothetical protein
MFGTSPVGQDAEMFNSSTSKVNGKRFISGTSVGKIS